MNIVKIFVIVMLMLAISLNCLCLNSFSEEVTSNDLDVVSQASIKAIQQESKYEALNQHYKDLEYENLWLKIGLIVIAGIAVSK